MKYIPHITVKYETDFTDDILNMEWNGAELDHDELANYREKAEYYVREHQEHDAIAKLKTNRPLTEKDIKSLEEILWSELGARADYEKEYGKSLWENLSVKSSDWI